MKSFKNDYLREQEFKDFIDQSLQNAIDNMDLSGRSTDELPEGLTNRYFTATRARNAVVEDVITDGVSDRSPSQNAVYDGLMTREPSLPVGGAVGQFLNHLKAWAFVTWGVITGKPTALVSSNWASNGNKLVSVNAGGTDLVLIDPPTGGGSGSSNSMVWVYDSTAVENIPNRVFSDFTNLYASFSAVSPDIERVIEVRSNLTIPLGTYDFDRAILTTNIPYSHRGLSQNFQVNFSNTSSGGSGKFFKLVENIYLIFMPTLDNTGGFILPIFGTGVNARQQTKIRCTIASLGGDAPTNTISLLTGGLPEFGSTVQLFLEDFTLPIDSYPSTYMSKLIRRDTGNMVSTVRIYLKRSILSEDYIENNGAVQVWLTDYNSTFGEGSGIHSPPRVWSIYDARFLGRATGEGFSNRSQMTLPEFRSNISSAEFQRSAGTESLNCALQSHFRKMGGTATITLSNMTEGQVVYLEVQSTGSAYVITWAGGTIKWPNDTVPTPTVTANRYDFYEFKRFNGRIYGKVSLGYT